MLQSNAFLVSGGTDWVREWDRQRAVLRHLLGAIDHEGLEPAAALLQRVRECRRRVAEPPAPLVRQLWDAALEEAWQAACCALYGDLGPAREHAEAAENSMEEMRLMLESWLD